MARTYAGMPLSHDSHFIGMKADASEADIRGIDS
jgi:hypothetical protein